MTANIADAVDSYKDRIIVGAKHGYALVNRHTGELSYIRKVWDEEGPQKAKRYVFESRPVSENRLIGDRMRFNDGAVDSRGRFWAGAMNDPKVQEPSDEGVLFRLDPDLKVHRVIESMTIPNGIGWNDADDTMYLTDSPTGKIYAFDFNPETGAISNRRVHFEFKGPGIPDGFAMDATGCIWSAIYGGGKVIRISQKGEVIGEISLPTRNVTCAAFVGTELFITTAKDEENDDQLPQSVRYSGRLFRVDVGVRGQPRHQFRFQN